MVGTGWMKFSPAEMKRIFECAKRHPEKHFTIHNRGLIVCSKVRRGQEIYVTPIDRWGDGTRPRRCLNPSCNAALKGAIPIENDERRWDT
jgi:hypothetical protein